MGVLTACSLSVRYIMNRLLTPDDTASILNISCKHVHKLCREGKLACVQITLKDRRFTERQIEDYIESQTIPRTVDRQPSKRLPSRHKGGDTKSSRVSGTGLVQEIRSLCQS